MSKKLTVKEIEEKIKAAFELIDDEDIDYIKEDYGTEGVGPILVALEDEGISISEYLPELEHIDTDCCAGDGSDAYAVFKYKPTGQLFGLEGWYASHEGYEWEDGFKEMEPFTVTHYRGKSK